MDPLLTLSGTRLASMLQRREVTSLEVVEAHVRHIQRVNPVLNAVVRDRFDEARAEAREADRRTASEEPADLPPFHGVPCTIKEAFALTGMPNTSGLVARKGVVADGDAITVARLREAGAIPLGVTNISELCMWMESNNRVYGRTNNPYDPRRIAGGSSGGEGAIIGAGGVPFGLGSDIGGSIRMPAFFNGVFGHKPTGGLVPSSGQYPVARGETLRFVTAGPLARRAEDLAPLVRILAGPDASSGLKDPASVDLADLRVLSIDSNGALPVSRDLRAAQRACEDALAARGASIRHTRVKALEKSLPIWSSMISAAAADGPSFSELLGSGTPIRAGAELVRWTLGRSPHTLAALGLALMEKIPKLLPHHGDRFVAMGAALRREILDLLGPHGVILYPPYPTPAPLHYRPLVPPFNWVYTAIWNVLEMPVTQVPLGLNAQGLPLGVQVVGAHGDDHVTIAVAMELERAFGGWVPPATVATR